jgi:autotransporter strand-loop-strand O-heptosyltransferase
MKRNADFFKDLVKRDETFLEKDPEIAITFRRGAKVTISGYTKKRYRIEFWNNKICEYSTDLSSGFFCAPSKTYYVPWHVKVFESEKLIKEEKVNLEGSHVHVYFDSSSLGDNLAWMPQVVRFAEIRKCKLILTTFYNYLFREQYPEITWNEPGSKLPERIDFSYSIGYHISEDRANHNPVDPKTSPLSKVACDILGIPYEEARPLMRSGFKREIKEKYVCIATHSTAGAKFWHRPNGWQDIVDYLNMQGFRVAVIQKEHTDLKNIIDLAGEKSLEERQAVLEHCEFFIGLGSGLSWLAWSMKKPVILISGFSDPFSEFQKDCYRIINRNVCNSCWNDIVHTFDKGDWWWCPRHKGTDRVFECTKSISSVDVIREITKISYELMH